MKAKTNLLSLLAICSLATQAMAIVSHSHASRKFLSQAESKATVTDNYVTYGNYRYNNDTSSPAADFIFGVLLIIMSFPVIWNNERKQVKIYNLLTKGEKECVDGDFKSPKQEHNWKLVFVSGETKNNSIIEDKDFGVKVENSVKLIRTVEMLQWVETTHTRDHRTHHEYSREWRQHIVNSHSFHDPSHRNPSSIPYESHTGNGQDILFGGFVLSNSQLVKLTKTQNLNITDEEINKMQEKTNQSLEAQGFEQLKRFQQNVLMTQSNENHKRGLAIGAEVGDVRISFQVVRCGPTTIIAQQVHNGTNFTFRQWNPKKLDLPLEQNNDPDEETVCLICACLPCCTCIDKCFQSIFKETLEIVVEDPKSKVDIFKDQHEDNNLTTKLFRFGGWFMQFMGIMLFFSPIIYGLSWIPLVGTLMAHGFSFIVGIFALVVSFTLTCLTIALAWLYYRPLYGAILLGCVGIGLAVLFLT